MKIWALQEAKAHLSELVKRASSGKPQEITLRGKPAVVVLSMQQYQKLKRPKLNLVDFLRNSPFMGADVEFTRAKDPMRDIEL